MIRAEKLTKSYGARRGIVDLTFEARPGEILGFLGPNGAGKTTAIKVLTGAFPPSGGRAWVDGHDVVADHLLVRESIGYLPENAPVYSAMSVEGFLGFMLSLKKPRMSRAARRKELERVLGAVDLADRRGQLVHSLSKGLRQRTGIAQALLGDPPVLILDEPTAGLDPRQVQAIRTLVANEAARGKTILLSTHILSEVEALAHRIAILDQGRLVAFGTLSELRRVRARRLRLRFTSPISEEAQVRQRLEGFFARLRARVPTIDESLGIAAPDAPLLESLRWESNCWTARLSGANDRADVAALNRALVEQGWDIVELAEEDPRLEEVFLESVSKAG